MPEYCFVKETSFGKKEEFYELEAGSALHQNFILVLADAPYSAHSLQGRVSSAQKLFCKEKPVNAARFMSKVMDTGAHTATYLVLNYCSSLTTEASVRRRRM